MPTTPPSSSSGPQDDRHVAYIPAHDSYSAWHWASDRFVNSWTVQYHTPHHPVKVTYLPTPHHDAWAHDCGADPYVAHAPMFCNWDLWRDRLDPVSVAVGGASSDQVLATHDIGEPVMIPVRRTPYAPSSTRGSLASSYQLVSEPEHGSSSHDQNPNVLPFKYVPAP
eukprot:812962-Pyramimonas_sp.AAC.1